MSINPDEFAAQVNYLAAIGRMVVPRAFAFAGRRVLFVGHVPFNAEELGSLLPEETEWYEHSYAPDDFAPGLVIVGRGDYTKDELRSLLRAIEGSPKVLPQEGFVDELLFGHDWWDEESESLRTMVDQHRGLQIARSVGVLAPVGIGVPQPVAKAGPPEPTLTPRPPINEVLRGAENAPAVSFSWPSTEAEETRGADEAELDLRARSRLNELGYNTNQPPSVRWRILTTRAVPELGLPKVASMIAWLCRTRKQQRGGRQKYARAISEWEQDLDRLKREVYPKHRPRFVWPRAEP